VVPSSPVDVPDGRSDSGIRRTAVPCLWPGATIVIAATGDSLTHEDLEDVRGRAPLLVISDAYQAAPWADVIYAPDSRWWKWRKEIDQVPEAVFPPHRYTLDWIAKEYYPSVVPLAYLGKLGLSNDPTGLYSGGHAGYQAINLAAHLVGRNARIVLIGYDMQAGVDGSNHFFGEHPDGSSLNYAAALPHYQSLVAPLAARKIEILNATKRTALHTFPRKPLLKALHQRCP